jgi:hypothetical protein
MLLLFRLHHRVAAMMQNTCSETQWQDHAVWLCFSATEVTGFCATKDSSAQEMNDRVSDVSSSALAWIAG